MNMTVPQQVQYQNQPQPQPSQQQLQPQISQQLQPQISQQQQQQQPQQPQQQQHQVAQHQVTQMAPQPQVPQVQHQQHMPPQGLNGGWQSESDIDARRKMIAKIVQLLQARKPNAPQDWLNKLPQMAKRLEETLYRTAATFTAYNDATTLKQRLQQLAMKMKQPRHHQQRQQQLQLQQQRQQQAQQVAQQRQQQQAQAQQAAQQQQVQQQQAQQVQQQQAQQVQQQQAQQQQAVQSQQPQRMVNMSDINPIMATNPPHQQNTVTPSTQTMPQVAPTYSQPGTTMNGTKPIAAVPTTSTPLAQATFNGTTAAQPLINQPRPGQPTTSASAPSSRTTSDRAQVLRHQQQRLLLLRHAAKCPHEDGQCPVTPHCAGMKRLWKHIAECKNQKCQVPHCVSSRYVLSHYHRCKDVRCPVCGPVREAIHRSHEKQKQMSQLKENQKLAIAQSQRGTQPMPASSQQVISQQAAAAPVQPPPKKPRPNKLIPPAVHGAPPVAQVVPSQPQPLHPTRPGGAPPGPTRPGYVYSGGQPTPPGQGGAPRPKPVEDLTLINSFTIKEIERHIESLNRGIQLTGTRLKSKCGEVLKMLQQHPHGWVFNSPVDPVELGLPDYFTVIKKPMDLGTIKKRLDNGIYDKLDTFQEEVNLTFQNAMLYNPEGSVVYNMANEMMQKFSGDFDNLMKQLKAEEDEKRIKGDACALCGSEKLLFEPPVFYCNGFKCSSQRIRRNSYYYVGGNNKYHWCHQCYGDLKDNQELQMPDAVLRKKDLLKKKNDEVREESWVHCDRCNRWIHQICGLFNTRKNQDQRSEYVCPRCSMHERKKKGQHEGTSTTPTAADLQRTKLSEYLENHIHGKVEVYIDKIAKEKAEKENIPIEQAKKSFEMGGPITIRQVTSMDRKLEVRERMKKRYAFKNYPDEFTYRCKCIIVFQKLDGVDVILFGLYVYEHDEKNPAPNQRSVYLSYLDSVHYMRPKKMRTYIYHEILVSYLDYVRKRGFSTVHIWACPPGKGDDYILYAKPADQKTPRDDRLKAWYYNMLTKAQERGIVGKVTNMYDLYFADPKNDATVVPYMEGDYYPGEVENCIRDMEEGKHSKKASNDGKKKKKTKSKKNKAGRAGTRSSGVDETALAASGILPPGYDQKSMEEGHQDYVMTKLGQIIEQMKDSFIVAYLAWDGAKKEDMAVPKEIVEARQRLALEGIKSVATVKSDNDSKPNADSTGSIDTDVKMASTKSDGLTNGNKSTLKQGGINGSGAMDTDKPSEVKPDQPQSSGVTTSEVRPSSTVKTEDMSPGTSKTNEAGNNGVKQGAAGGIENKSQAPSSDDVKKKVMAVQREGKFAAMEARKRTIEGKIKGAAKTTTEKDKPKTKSAMITVKDRYGKLVKVLDDDEEEMDCEFLNNRQLFLELCQTNNYQFDHMRRAKHSSMMVLWHLHNRDAPKFVQQCAQCAREILSGYRYHCPTCADYDLCQDCYQRPSPQKHPHPLKPIAVSNNQKTEQTEEQRRERQRSIQLHMTLLLHAATCSSAKCHSQNCAKMKGLLQHGEKCTTKAQGGCNICKRIWTLLQIHARQCKDPKCPVPKCLAIRERFRQIAAQQRAMDDRRRQHFNTISTG